MTKATVSADQVTTAMLAALPADQRSLLVKDPDSSHVAGAWICDREWMDEQMRLGRRRWRTDDLFVLGTLWWYSVSRQLITPTITSSFLTGTPLSPELGDVTLHWRSDGIIRGVTSYRVATEPMATVLDTALGTTIEQVARICGKGERRLWSLAVDSIANCYLRLGVAVGRVEEAQDAAKRLVGDISEKLPQPRFESVHSSQGDVRQVFVRRGSCCLIYKAPDKNYCMSCPRQHPETRHERLRDRAARAAG